jgi:hypothetical protein
LSEWKIKATYLIVTDFELSLIGETTALECRNGSRVMRLRALRLCVVAAGMACSLVGPAAADLIDGTLSIRGTDIIKYAANTILFVAGSSDVGAATGSFALQGFNLQDSVTMRNEGVAISYASPALDTGSNLSCGGGAGCIYTADSGTGNVTWFNIIGPYSVTQTNGVSLNIVASGIAFLTGFDPTPGTFNFSSQGPDNTTVTFSATTVAVPGPIVGAGLPGLVFAFGGLVAWGRRKLKGAAIAA